MGVNVKVHPKFSYRGDIHFDTGGKLTQKFFLSWGEYTPQKGGRTHPEPLIGPPANKKSPWTEKSEQGLFYRDFFGGVLLSHTATHAVPSALKGLTSEFGMVSGVSPSLLPPKKIAIQTHQNA